MAAARGGLGGGVFLADEGQGLFVEPAILDDAIRRIRPGDRIEAVGFVTAGPASLSLGEAVVRVTGTAAPPAVRRVPSVYPPEAQALWRHIFEALWPDALPVEIEMEIVSRIDRDGACELVGMTGPRNTSVRCVVPGRPPAAAVPGAVVAVRGVYRVTATDRDVSRPLPDALDVWVDAAADVRIVRQPPWWMRPGAVRSLVGSLVACSGAAAVAR